MIIPPGPACSIRQIVFAGKRMRRICAAKTSSDSYFSSASIEGERADFPHEKSIACLYSLPRSISSYFFLPVRLEHRHRRLAVQQNRNYRRNTNTISNADPLSWRGRSLAARAELLSALGDLVVIPFRASRSPADPALASVVYLPPWRYSGLGRQSGSAVPAHRPLLRLPESYRPPGRSPRLASPRQPASQNRSI